MVKTQTIEIPQELEPAFQKYAKQTDRYLYGAAGGKREQVSRARREALKEKSLFGFFSEFWKLLDESEKTAWKNAGAITGLTNWQLFVSDNAARLKHDLELSEPPNNLWQVRTGKLEIQDPATEIILKQEHPLDYWVVSKVRGQSWKEQLELIKERIIPPIELKVRYKADLTAIGETQVARYYARLWSSFQGIDRFTEYGINFNPDTDWTLGEQTTGIFPGHLIGYTLFLEIKGYRGELLFDNIRAIHTATNWARDPRCDKIQREFAKAFAIVRPFWEPVSIPSGATYESEYPLTA